MGRKNSRVGRSNDRGRRNRDKLQNLGVPRGGRVVTPIEDMVLPDGRCDFVSRRKPKVRFATKDKAERALRQAQLKRANTGNPRVEKRIYPCPEGGCGGWHLSAREEFDEEFWEDRKAFYADKREREGR